MKDLRGKRVLVTGAADGIGRGAALAFASEGSRLFLVDVNEDGLESVAGEVRGLGAECDTRVTDVSDREAVRALAGAVEVGPGGVDILVNAAGVCVVSDVLDTSPDDWEWLLGVNLRGPINTIEAFVPGMVERGSGHVVNVASAGGLVYFAMIGAYCAGKAGLVALTEALGQEIHGDGVGTTVVCPGFTNTGIMGRMRFHGYSSEKLRRVIDAVMRRSLSAERTGEQVVAAVRRDRPLLVTTVPAKLVVLLNRALPRLVRAILRGGRRMNVRLFST